jgi:rubredoxin
MRKVKLRYRCSLCGLELRVDRAVDEDPVPPRHCMEDMDLEVPVD